MRVLEIRDELGHFDLGLVQTSNVLEIHAVGHFDLVAAINFNLVPVLESKVKPSDFGKPKSKLKSENHLEF